MFKKVKVVMLPTNEKADLWLDNFGTGLYFGFTTATGVSYQHLYFLSDEEIKEGDWFVYDEKLVFQHDGYMNTLSKCKKIIATTDKSLSKTIKSSYVQFGDNVEETKIEFLSQPSQSFIEKYVEEYNKRNVITEVMVEYIDEGVQDKYLTWLKGELIWNEKIILKINPKDNTITIRKVKDSWNREEIITLLHHFKFCGDDVEKFAEENL